MAISKNKLFYILQKGNQGHNPYPQGYFLDKKDLEHQLNNTDFLEKKGDLWVSKDDSFYYRIDKADLINEVIKWEYFINNY